MTLFFLVSIIATMVVFSLSQKSVLIRDMERLESRRARIAAEAGIQRGLAELQAVADAPQTPVLLQDAWATLGNKGADNFKIGNATFRMQIVDNSGRFDLNLLTQAQMLNLPLTQEQIDSLLDWREAGQTVRTEGGKDQYYNDLTNPYNPRLGLLQSMDELLLVKGFTLPALYDTPTTTQNSLGVAFANPNLNLTTPLPIVDMVTLDTYSPNTAPDGNGKVNLNLPTLTAPQLVQRIAGLTLPIATTIIAQRAVQPGGQFARLSQVIQLPGISANQTVLRALLDGATITPQTRLQGKINVNTAAEGVLAAIDGIGSDLAKSIVDRQSGTGYTQLSDLLTISSTPQFVAAVADNFTVQSQSFEIRSIGKVGSTQVILQATVVIENGQIKIRRVQEAPFLDMPTRWAWDDPTNDVVLQEAS